MSEDGVKVMPVAQVVLLVKDGTPVGAEVVWESTVRQVPDACTVLNLLRAAMGDAAWMVRQVDRVKIGAEDPHQLSGDERSVQ